jgi:transposase
MAYTIVQKKGDAYYLCEVTGTWDPVKKNSKQTRKYLGRCDKDGNLLSPSKNIIARSCTFGSYYLILKVAEQTGLLNSLRDSFGNERGTMIAALAILRIISPGSFNGFADKMDESYLPELLSLGNKTDSSSITRFLQDIGNDVDSRMHLFMSLASGNGAVIFDTTALPTSSEELEFAEYGRSYRRTHVKQTNLGIAFSSEKGLPFMYKMYPGSLSDVSLVRNMAADVRDIGMEDVEYVLDRGFFSEANLKELLDSGDGFTIAMPARLDIFKECLSEAVKHIENPEMSSRLDGSVVRCRETCRIFADSVVRMLVFQDDRRRSAEIDSLYSVLEELETKMSGRSWNDRMNGLSKSEIRDMSMFDLTEGNGKVTVKRRRNSISARENRCGRFVVVTTSELPWKDVLIRYRKRNEIEYQFSQLKSDLDGGVTNLSDMGSAQGAVLTEFIALILRTELVNRLRRNGLINSIHVPKVIGVMNKLKISYMGSEWRLNEMTREMRDMLSSLDIPLPPNRY